MVFVESIVRDYGIKKGFVYNDRNGSVKIVCEGLEAAVNDFIEAIKTSKEGISVDIREFRDEVYLPEFGRVIVDLDREIFERLGVGVRRLGSIDSSLKVVRKDTAKLGSIDRKLDTLPERIAGALKDVLKK